MDNLALDLRCDETPIGPSSVFQFCRFCNGLGCVCCTTERARMEARPNGGYVPICALTDKQLEDPNVWDILRIFLHRNVVMRSKSAGNISRKEALKQLAQGKWGQSFLREKEATAIPKLMAYLEETYGSFNPPLEYTGNVTVIYTIDTSGA